MNSIIKPDGRLTMDDGMGANTTCHPSNSDDLKSQTLLLSVLLVCSLNFLETLRNYN